MHLSALDDTNPPDLSISVAITHVAALLLRGTELEHHMLFAYLLKGVWAMWGYLIE